MGRTEFLALAGVGRERENPRSERSEPAALKVQLVEVGALIDFEVVSVNTEVEEESE